MNLEIQISLQIWEVHSHYFFESVFCCFFLCSPSRALVICTLVLLMMSYWASRLPSFLSFYFSFCSSAWIISTYLSLSLLFCLLKSAFYWILQFSHCVLHLQNFCLVHFYIFYLYWTSHFVLIYFLDIIELPSIWLDNFLFGQTLLHTHTSGKQSQSEYLYNNYSEIFVMQFLDLHFFGVTLEE